MDKACEIQVVSEHRKQNDAFQLPGAKIAVEVFKNGIKNFHVLCCKYYNYKGHSCNHNQLATSLTARNLHYNEILRDNEPARLYMDIEWPFTAFSKSKTEILDLLLNKCLYEFCGQRWSYVVLEGSRNAKMSFHVIFPNNIFRSITHDMKRFIMAFNSYLATKHGKELFYDKKYSNGKEISTCVMDISVYTTNRQFRLLNQSKKADEAKTPLVINKELCYGMTEEIQPLDTIIQTFNFLPKLIHDDASLAIEPGFVTSLIRKRNVVWRSGAKLKSDLHWIKESRDEKYKGRKVAVITPNRDKDLYIRSDYDIMNAFCAPSLRMTDFSCLFLPILTSLLTSHNIDMADIRTWIAKRSPERTTQIIKYAREEMTSNPSLSTCSAAMYYLRHMYKRVIDLRPDPMSKYGKQLFSGEETEAWNYPDGQQHAVGSKEEMITLLNKINRKTTYSSNRDTTRRMYRITGRMGVGKTTALIEYLMHKLICGKMASVTYVAPRVILVDDVAERANRVNDDNDFKSLRKKLHNVLVQKIRYGVIDIDCLSKSFNQADVQQVFTSVCINSINRAPINNDVLVIDEVAMNVGNMWMHWTKQISQPSDIKAQRNRMDLSTDLSVIDGVCQRMHNAQIVFVVDAAFTPSLAKAYDNMWSLSLVNKPMQEIISEKTWQEKMKKENDTKSLLAETEVSFLEESSEDEWRHWLLSKVRKSYTGGGVPFVVQKTDGKHKVYCEAQPSNIVVYQDNPSYKPGIYDKVYEYYDFSCLARKLYDTIYGERQTVVIYASTVLTLRLIFKFLTQCSNSHKDMPFPAYLSGHAGSASTLDRRDAVNDAIVKSPYLITTIVLGAGYSNTTENAFDQAFMFLEFKHGTPPLADMIQLSARIRSIRHRTLHYAVRSQGFSNIFTKSDEAKKDTTVAKAIDVRSKSLKDKNHARALERHHVDEFSLNNALICDNAFAKVHIRNTLKIAFSVAKKSENSSGRLQYIQPNFHTVEPNFDTAMDMAKVSAPLTRRLRKLGKDSPHVTSYPLKRKFENEDSKAAPISQKKQHFLMPKIEEDKESIFHKPPVVPKTRPEWIENGASAMFYSDDNDDVSEFDEYDVSESETNNSETDYSENEQYDDL